MIRIEIRLIGMGRKVMNDGASFIPSVLTLLIVPGSTNTLLTAAGASSLAAIIG